MRGPAFFAYADNYLIDVPTIDQFYAGPFVEHREHLDERQEEQRLRDQVGSFRHPIRQRNGPALTSVSHVG
jgi:hypothetical protein